MLPLRLTPREAADVLRMRGMRTLRARLAEYGVAVVPCGRSFRVRALDLAVALAGSLRGPDGSPAISALGVVVPKGERPWDQP